MIEALKLALEALENDYMVEWPAMNRPKKVEEKRQEAIQAGKQAIAELESQEPVGVVNINDEGDWYFLPLVSTDKLPEGTKFYTHRTTAHRARACGCSQY